MVIKIEIRWDEEAEVWVAINDDLGIALESGSYDALIERLKVVVPEMAELNGINGYSTINLETRNRQVACA